jgi:DNA polymerase-3 subunit delta'
VVGHEELQERLARAVEGGRLPASLLLRGPVGVGKQRLALWLGQLLLCEAGTACGRCRSCRLALRLEHPDLHWFFPLPRPRGASTPSKLREKLEDARLEELEERRARPLAVRDPEGATGIYLAAVQEMKSKASRRPAMGARTVFVVGDAEAMVPQASSPEAANAFLKLLEEPPEDAFILLTSSRPGALLPTIRSRTLELRVLPVPAADVERLLVERAGVAPERAASLARRAQGSPGRALRALSDAAGASRQRAEELLGAALSGDRAARWALAAALSPSGARGEFDDVLASTTELLRDLLAATLGRPDLGFDPEAVSSLAAEVPPPHALLEAIARVEEARDEAAGNVNPQAITAGLLTDLRALLASA